MMNLDVLVPGHGLVEAFGSAWPIVILGILALAAVSVALLIRDLKKKTKRRKTKNNVSPQPWLWALLMSFYPEVWISAKDHLRETIRNP